MAAISSRVRKAVREIPELIIVIHGDGWHDPAL
jgi:hypothetical protein